MYDIELLFYKSARSRSLKLQLEAVVCSPMPNVKDVYPIPHSQEDIRPPLKRSLFPVQRVTKLRPVGRSQNLSFFLGGGGGGGKKIKKRVQEQKIKFQVGKKIPTRPLDRKQTFF